MGTQSQFWGLSWEATIDMTAFIVNHILNTNSAFLSSLSVQVPELPNYLTSAPTFPLFISFQSGVLTLQVQKDLVHFG